MPKILNRSPSAATSTELRTQADHARDLANALSPRDETTRRLRRVADELEAEAARKHAETCRGHAETALRRERREKR